MIAKALARSSKARFIQFDMSIFTDKWYGESQKLVTALFSLVNNSSLRLRNFLGKKDTACDYIHR